MKTQITFPFQQKQEFPPSSSQDIRYTPQIVTLKTEDIRYIHVKLSH